MHFETPTTHFSAARRALLGVAAAAAVLVLPESASAAPLWPDPPASPIAKIVTILFFLVFAVGIVVAVGYVLALRGAARAEVDADAPASTDKSPRFAVYGGIAVFAICAISGGLSLAKSSTAQESIAGTGDFKVTTFSKPGLRVAHITKAPKGPAYSIRVNAQQFLWRYEYTGVKGAWKTYSYGDLVIPAGVTVMLDFTSSDAEAAWWVPQLGGSVTAMPGYANKVWLRADKPGLYSGAGTVVNGTNYANMTTKVTAVDSRLFVRWLAGKQIEISEAMTALGLERASGAEAQLLSGKTGAGVGTAESELDQAAAADQQGKNK